MFRGSSAWFFHLSYSLVLLTLATRPAEANGKTTTQKPEQQVEVSCNAGLHEVSTCVYDCPGERTCQNLNGPYPTCPPEVLVNCRHKCRCDVGYVRNKSNGVCISTKQCANCDKFTEYYKCDGAYTEDCVGRCHCLPFYKCTRGDPAARTNK